jgi:peptidoglycan/xylan/chitin deacetylase (PgdA/CDA1 family)
VPWKCRRGRGVESATVPQRQINLTFHGIGDPARPLDRAEADVWLEGAQFVSVLDAIGRRDDVRISFDDGNASDLEHALPALRERGLRATFFICAGRLGQPGFVDADGVRRLRSAGMSIGSHGMNHVSWRGLNRSETRREIIQAKRALEDTVEEPVVEASCPFGAYDRRSLSALRAAGFKRVYASDGGPATPQDWLVARNTMHRWDSAESVERLLDGSNAGVSPARRAKRWVKRWR